MASIFAGYIMPFLVGVAIYSVIAYRIHSRGGPARLFIIFSLIGFGPSLLYALIADDSDTMLFVISVVAAIISVLILWLKFYRNKK